jgi:hypothetical protein
MHSFPLRLITSIEFMFFFVVFVFARHHNVISVVQKLIINIRNETITPVPSSVQEKDHIQTRLERCIPFQNTHMRSLRILNY